MLPGYLPLNQLKAAKLPIEKSGGQYGLPDLFLCAGP
jgi:hypothetical protein